MAADHGEPNAMYMYSKILKNGEDGETDKLDAMKYLLMAAKAGNNSALIDLMSDLGDDDDNKEDEEEEEEENDDNDSDLLSLLKKLHNLLE